MPLTICYRNAFFLKHCISPSPSNTWLKKSILLEGRFSILWKCYNQLGFIAPVESEDNALALRCFEFQGKKGLQNIGDVQEASICDFFVTKLIFSWDCAAVEEDCCMILRKDAAVGNLWIGATSHSHVSGLEILDSANNHICCWRKIICIFFYFLHWKNAHPYSMSVLPDKMHRIICGWSNVNIAQLLLIHWIMSTYSSFYGEDLAFFFSEKRT